MILRRIAGAIYWRARRLLPKKTQRRLLRDFARYYANRFYKYSGVARRTKETDAAYLTWLGHVVEKGLAMPDMRLGFGGERVRELLAKLDAYASAHGQRDLPYIMGVTVLKTYAQVHRERGFALDADILAAIDALPDADAPAVCAKAEYTREEFFSAKDAAFPELAHARKSVRHYDPGKPIAVERIVRAIELAATAPSACDRQPARVHIITGKEQIAACLALQNGNRGFGHLCDKLLIVCGDLRTIYDAHEFLDLNTNVGIFVMNLSYALYHGEIGHCILNWYAQPELDRKLRAAAGIPEHENVVCLIACGEVPEKFRIAVSPRYEAEHFYVVH